MMPKSKRKADIVVEDVVEYINLDKGLVAGLLDLDKDELAAVLADVANKGSISNASFKRARIDRPSFSDAKWSELAPQLGLPVHNMESDDFPKFSTPRYRQPPSFQKAMFENGWRSQDVYRETVEKTTEEAIVRVLDAVCQLKVVACKGCISDS
jgi:hypothetical protein